MTFTETSYCYRSLGNPKRVAIKVEAMCFFASQRIAVVVHDHERKISTITAETLCLCSTLDLYFHDIR